jgi:enoyl-CoA hydratase/carnithine racemase
MNPLQIAIWNGIVMGGGVGLSCHSKIRIATDNTVYAMPETGIGFFTDVGGSYFLSRVHNNISLGLYLGLTGYRLKAKDLVRWGVATHFVSSENIENLKKDISLNVK